MLVSHQKIHFYQTGGPQPRMTIATRYRPQLLTLGAWSIATGPLQTARQLSAVATLHMKTRPPSQLTSQSCAQKVYLIGATPYVALDHARNVEDPGAALLERTVARAI